VAELRQFSSSPIAASPALSPADGPFDLVLANHVFYYVKQLDEQVSALVNALAPRGLFLASMAGQENTLIQFWFRAFALLGQPVPFHTAEDLQAALDFRGIPFRRQEVRYQLAFDDSEENRLRIMRFLLGDHFAAMPRQPLLDLFAPYANAGRVKMSVVHGQFIVAGRLST
jgi:trans-aconitate 2-methyltransferase